MTEPGGPPTGGIQLIIEALTRLIDAAAHLAVARTQ
jgi:hypothetical protein